MPEEEQQMDYNPQEVKKLEAKYKNQRNATNNAQALKTAVDVASKSQDPYVGGIAKAVKAADKVTGGAVTNLGGKAMNLGMKTAPLGGLAQWGLNKLGESGMTNRIGSALNKKNNSTPTRAKSNMKSNAVAEGKDDSFLNRREVEDKTSDGGEVGLKATAKVLKIGLIAFAPVMVVVVFMCLFVAASQTYLSVIGIGNADEVSDNDADTQIRENGSEGLDEEIKDPEPVSVDSSIFDGDIYLASNECFDGLPQKFNKNNFVANTRSREYNEADLKDLEDYYSDINGYEGYNMDTVYKFFFKLLYIQRRYEKDYGIGNNIGEKKLDTALIMSVLSLQSENKSEVFISNVKDYKINSKTDGEKENYKYFKYDHDWSNYKSTKDDSSHDIEVLAQGMVKKTSDSGCSDTIDGACYELVSDSEYKEFLKGFLEKKYFLNPAGIEILPSIPGSNVPGTPSNPSEQPTLPTTPAQGNFRNWTQCGQSWSDKKVGSSGKTMCKIGCLIVSVTMQIARSRTITLESPIDPGIALDYYKFTKSGGLYWNSPSNLAPNFKYHTAINLAGMSKESIAKKLSSYDSSKYYMVLAVSKKNRKSVHHYVALDYVDTSTNKIYIMDPSSTKQTDLYEYYKVYKAHIYEKKD